jgi:putative two-component system response regulator
VLARASVERRRVMLMQQQLESAHTLALTAIASLVGHRDWETGKHLQRVSIYMRALAMGLARDPRYQEYLSKERVELLVQLAPIHDLGKLALPDRILKKPAPLTPEEYELARRHVASGCDLLMQVAAQAGIADQELLRLARDLIGGHHERWDGRGYPARLAGEEIPLAGRMMALVDVYDALTSRRPYKAPMSHADAVEHIRRGRSHQFDPAVVDVFLRDAGTWRAIAEAHPDEETEPPPASQRAHA